MAKIEPPQEFVVRNDCPCGSTIGPAIAALTGIRTVDIGISCWSMHSIRETIGVEDVDSSIKLFTAFYKHFGEYGLPWYLLRWDVRAADYPRSFCWQA